MKSSRKSTTRVSTVATAQAGVEGLEVTGDLFGQSHRFTHDGRTVVVRLPEVALGDDLQPIAEHRERASMRSSLTRDPLPETSTYAIEWLDVSVAVNEQITVPTQLLKMSPKRPEITGPTLQKRLDKIIVEYEGRVAAALVHWEQVVRWVSGSSLLGTPSARVGRASAARLSFTYLRQAKDGHRFWAPTHLLTVLGGTRIDAALWAKVGKTLSEGYEEPIWFRYLDDAYHRRIARDLGGSILSSAIACETLAREAFWLRGGGTAHLAARDLLDRVPVSAILRKWNRLTGLPNDASRVRSVERAFQLRNRLMHAGGSGSNPTEAEVEELLRASRDFVSSGDEWYFAAQSLPNPRLSVA